MTMRAHQLDEKIAGLQADLTKTRQELDNQQSERTKIAYGLSLSVKLCLIRVDRQLEAQANEQLRNVYDQLLQAGVDKHESERETKLKETLVNLQRLLPGTLHRPSSHWKDNLIMRHDQAYADASWTCASPHSANMRQLCRSF